MSNKYKNWKTFLGQTNHSLKEMGWEIKVGNAGCKSMPDVYKCEAWKDGKMKAATMFAVGLDFKWLKEEDLIERIGYMDHNIRCGRYDEKKDED